MHYDPRRNQRSDIVIWSTNWKTK